MGYVEFRFELLTFYVFALAHRIKKRYEKSITRKTLQKKRYRNQIVRKKLQYIIFLIRDSNSTYPRTIR